MSPNQVTNRFSLVALIFFFCLGQSIECIGQQKNSNIKGVVMTDNNGPIPNVNVIIRNSKNNFTSGTTTDSSGIFSFSRIPSGGPYSFSFSAAGFESQTLSGYSVKESSDLSLVITMKESVISMDQVIVIGYGTQKRKDLTGSIASVGSKEFKDLASTRIDQALLGKVAGVQVKPVSGEPGVAPQIRIRGIGSISAGPDPLYVVDGYPVGSIETLNPNDIESIDILKDASATAIYGSRGANGVIIINTKRGRAGKPVITFDTYTGWQKVAKKPEMMNAKEMAQYFYDGIKNRNIDEGRPVTGPPDTWFRIVPPVILDVLDGRNTHDVDALDVVLHTAPQSQYQLTATGGNENVKYALSGEYLTQKGIVLNSNFDRYSLRANIDAKLSNRLSARINLNPSYTDKNALPTTGNQGEGILGSAMATHNFYPLLDENGEYFFFGGLAAQANFSNPLAVANEYKANQKSFRLLNNINVDYKIIEDLKLSVLAGASFLNTKRTTFKPSLPVFFNNPPTGTDNSFSSINWITEATLNYNKKLNKHNLAGLVGYTAQKENGYSNFLESNRYPNNLIQTLSAVGGQITNGSSEKYTWSILSYLARLNYNFNNKYYLTASIRTDGSSRFGANKKYGVFPSAAVAWRISDEDFFKGIEFVNELKLRTSYGETGNNNIGNYEQYATINYLTYDLGGVAVGGFAPQRLSNPSLTWEKQQSVNIGIDASFLERRLSFTVDYFRSKNKDLLLNVNIPAITGFTNALKNIGEVQNTGWEFVVRSVNLNQQLTWTTDFNLSAYRNKVVKLGPEGDPIFTDNNVTMLGQPIGMFYGLIVDGIFKSQAELDKGPIYNPGASDRSRIGDVRFKDISGPNGRPDGIINSFDNTIMGTPYPDFYYGMTNNFSYKNFSLTISLQGSHGNKIYDLSRSAGNSTRARVRVYAFNNNYWKSEQEPGDGKTPRPNDAPTGGVRLPSQRYLDNGTYLRFNNIIASYSLPRQFFSKLKLSAARVYVNATNPLLITKNTAFNPDVSFSSDPLRPGNESNDYPLAKSLIIGLNISF
ncbi:SusC/RagA family TonB-linked outer membrane protein [Terrimonas pollutisoli]|uniref:SusC/RagA family TonB-linked outer membrane protein n=1 Tax=Terrimonas pollutisoli TaxID=3034147 RepID=UPI0023EB2131|nr:TonB-dependent receptor [Terrimonas sp. H1YJ31]